ncbi:Uncharacterised protein [Pannonibacter phragmitetus]|uniref:Arc-like DNA binding domain-containing protein n=1 Tax=Pannonibacter phragmitetus TaxID=121719 RepID=A0A378ZPT4_9HYPH|nr:Uncharacterised protein [Pannonibacter phragmitetus]
MSRQDWSKILLRLPHEARQFLENETLKNASSLNSEVVRCIRQRMEEMENSQAHAGGRSQVSQSGSPA